MSAPTEPFHPHSILRHLTDGSSFTTTEPTVPGISQRLWIGSQLLTSLIGQVSRHDLPWLLSSTADWAAAADALAMAILQQQKLEPGLLTTELLGDYLASVESRRRRRAGKSAAAAAIDTAKGEEGSHS